MSDPRAKTANPVAAPAPRRRQGFWLTVGEIVGVLALIVTGLNFWEGRKQHAEEAAREQARSQAALAFVAVGEADAQGHAIDLKPLKAVQAIQSQRYDFPQVVLDHPMDVTAERPRIQADWIAGGLKRALDTAHAKASGEARLPVVIETTYVEDGDSHSDVSLYRIGFAWKRGFLGGWQIRLEGIALAKRNLAGDPGKAADARWAVEQTGLAGR
jgi:hypothetical protein